ncbi:dihydrodipicolinate synthase chloroplast precursor [Micromonas pusilla CCMP1545]|uniref:4-hydroxy-tetrahydrodipicolinate synthase n=1 Tax=Micromonas pusilla (strain CCMP1545) TaxID=564608 RepID=C1MLG6_MICPC|nr:dihydrodipicolinate synthase chloroplast precursor [Micromonas pusilla CCMP1545]EEH59937.1 dihydrodipicolinate synthase chloroplast precursor [Micromonas pusilla CCMP1545]|eukprot:XP_003056561.1 dihydrodipicolinate synthase chloroplast precursor [Micromonas pusilla CCMP1545]
MPTLAKISAAQVVNAHFFSRSTRRGVKQASIASNASKTWTNASMMQMTATVEEIQKTRLITAIKTPYLASGKIDLAAYDKLVENQIECGVGGLVVGGTTGEGQLMSWDEHIMLIAHTAKLYGDKLQVIGNTGSNSTREAVHASSQGFAVGMDAALHINPYYGKTSKKGIIAHFNAVLKYGPTIVYNVPARTSQDISPEIMLELAEHKNFAGIKECEGNARIKYYTDQGIVCWSGNDDEAHDARYEAGAVGVISVTSNIVPRLMSQLINDGPNPELRDRLLPMMISTLRLFTEPNPIGLNTMLAMLDCAEPVFRLPYIQYDEELRAQGAALIRGIGLEHTPGSKLLDLRNSDFTTLSEW